MPRVRTDISMSLDGYVAGPNQSAADGLGQGGEALHEWALPATSDASRAAMAAMEADVGAVIMGRNMFGPVRGGWGDSQWNGWWGEDPPFHVPVFVLTHHAREPQPMRGGTTFHFVTDGPEAALALAREVAGDQDVHVAGGASAVRQYIRTGLLDELRLHVVPLVLGAGERLLDDLGDPAPVFEVESAVEAPGVTHLTYRIGS